MEAYKRGDPWNLPEDPRERKKRSEEIAEDLCKQFDEIFYEFANKILEEVRASNRIETQRNLGSQALKESESPKAP